MQVGNRSLVQRCLHSMPLEQEACKSTLVTRSPLMASLPRILLLLDLVDLTTSGYSDYPLIPWFRILLAGGSADMRGTEENCMVVS